MTQKNETPILLLTLLITVGLLGGGLWLLSKKFPLLSCFFDSTNCQEISKASTGGNKEMSLGGSQMFLDDETAAKKAGIIAFQEEKYSEAIEQFQASLKLQKNDPETLIYLNNAKAASGNPLKIAVVVPIGGNLGVAKEILRGVAQAQNEINNNAGIQGRLLQIVIANDDNNPDSAKEIARQLVADESILAVVGHNSSEASFAAAPEYQKGGIVMISPTSKAKNLAEVGNYIFRTVPSDREESDLLSNYTTKILNKKQVAICEDSQSASSRSIKSYFITSVPKNGGKIVDIDCDLASGNFDANAIISDTIAKGGKVILIAPDVNRLNPAIELARANQNKLTLLGSSTFYSFQTLQEGQSNVNGLILAVPWHQDAIENNPFRKNAELLWGGGVNWRTALAYDATKTIATALKQGNTSRQEIQEKLSAPNFSVDGATGKVQFLPSGDRKGAAILVRVKPGKNSGTGFDFEPLLNGN